METRPVKTIQIHEHLRPKLGDLYENDCIFDKFECVISSDGKYFATGSYHNYFHVYDRTGRNDVCVEATNAPPPPPSPPHSSKSSGSRGAKQTTTSAPQNSNNGPLSGTNPKIVTDTNLIDFSRKTMNLAWHPHESILAVCGANNLYIYNR